MSFAVGLDHATIPMPAGAEGRVRTFFGSILCLSEVPKPATLIRNGGVWYEFEDGRQLHLQVEDDFRPLERPHPAIRVQNIDRLALALEEAGYGIEWDKALAPRRRFYTRDPFGNRLEMIETPRLRRGTQPESPVHGRESTVSNLQDSIPLARKFASFLQNMLGFFVKTEYSSIRSIASLVLLVSFCKRRI